MSEATAQVIDTAFKLYEHYAANEQGDYHQTMLVLFRDLKTLDPVRFEAIKQAALIRSNQPPPAGGTLSVDAHDGITTGDKFG